MGSGLESGFRSGDWAGHDRVLIWWSSIHTLIDLAVWHEALSYWKKQSSELENIVSAEGSKFSSRTICTWLDSCVLHKDKSA